MTTALIFALSAPWLPPVVLACAAVTVAVWAARKVRAS